MAPSPARVDRRRFLRLGAAATGAALGSGLEEPVSGASPSPSGMRYRRLGDTGLQVSEIAFGAHGVDNASLMAAAFEAGITTFCTSGQYLDGREEESLGEAIRRSGAPRDRLVLVTGNRTPPGTSRRTILEAIDASLRRLRTDHIDVYYTAEVCTADDLRVDGLFEAVEEAKRAGKVGHLAMSGHCGGMQPALRAAIEDGRFGMLFTRYDFVSYPDQDGILRRAAERGLGAIVFKVTAGNRQREIEDLEKGGLSLRQAAVKWALGHSYVSSVALSITTFEDLRAVTAAVVTRLTEAESEMLGRYAARMDDQYCRFCRTCEAVCPRGVAVAEVMRYAMYFADYGREKRAMQLYDALPRERRAAACDGCPGPCEAACPFGRKVRAGLQVAHRQLVFSRA
jgi:aryl-alcohol dehydrogenase-like predicted oxidoreductase